MPLTEQMYRSWVCRFGRLARVGVSDRPQLDEFFGRVGWSNLQQLGVSESGWLRAAFASLASHAIGPHALPRDSSRRMLTVSCLSAGLSHSSLYRRLTSRPTPSDPMGWSPQDRADSSRVCRSSSSSRLCAQAVLALCRYRNRPPTCELQNSFTDLNLINAT